MSVPSNHRLIAGKRELLFSPGTSSSQWRYSSHSTTMSSSVGWEISSDTLLWQLCMAVLYVQGVTRIGKWWMLAQNHIFPNDIPDLPGYWACVSYLHIQSSPESCSQELQHYSAQLLALTFSLSLFQCAFLPDPICIFHQCDLHRKQSMVSGHRHYITARTRWTSVIWPSEWTILQILSENYLSGLRTWIKMWTTVIRIAVMSGKSCGLSACTSA